MQEIIQQAINEHIAAGHSVSQPERLFHRIMAELSARCVDANFTPADRLTLDTFLAAPNSSGLYLPFTYLLGGCYKKDANGYTALTYNHDDSAEVTFQTEAEARQFLQDFWQTKTTSNSSCTGDPEQLSNAK